METLTRSKPKANKEHKCSFCFQPIKKGHNYDKSTHKFDGEIYTWKSHFHCGELANKLRWFDDCDEGLSGEDFCECVRHEYQNIMSETQIELYESKGFIYPKFSEQLEFVLKHHNFITP